jgi:3-methylfumaryl-CoA hydratase
VSKQGKTLQMPEFEEWIGRRADTPDAATPRLLAEFRATLAPHLFEPGDPDVAPPGFHWCLAPALPAAAELGEDGSAAHAGLVPPVPLPRRMWAGGSIETFAPIRRGAAIHRLSSLEAVTRRDGSSGPLYFVSLRHVIMAEGSLAVRERQDLVFRDASSQPGAGRKGADAQDDLAWTVDAGPVLLFRFSALTFNSHRIHYDERYARSEGYPGLLVQGPLQAALMLNQISVLKGEVPRRFDYRCLAPLFSGPSLRVASRGDEVRVIRADGIITAEGRTRAQDT